MIIIDGAFEEGGGQIIRTSMALSAITQKPIEIIHVRANRERPGLQPQHLTACLAVREITNGNLRFATLKSQHFTFEPGPIKGGMYEFKIGTAGSATLVAQTVLPILLHAKEPSEIIIYGGTHLTHSPSFDYFQKVFEPALRLFGIHMESTLHNCGFYPKGGGKIAIKIAPQPILGNSNWNAPNYLQGIIRLVGLPEHIAQRELKILQANGIQDIEIYHQQYNLSPGNSILLWAPYVGGSGLGERGKPAEKVAEEALKAYKLENSEIDCHLADQLLLYAALAKGQTQYTTSLHTSHLITNAHIINQFLRRNITLGPNGLVSIQ
ncbi:MAG TPA: RNA 3'-terminal phosphate cyclase [Gammaproteobacteria bacterium]|nr:RNA 3'-terminal phosphate cyclase [Gammaproteobacteria bacterium]